MKHKWKITCGPRFIGSGTIEAETERDAMSQVLIAQAGKVDADKSYSVTVGDATMSSYGDEFGRSANVAGYGDDAEQEKMEGDHHFQPEIVVPIRATGESIRKIVEATEKASKAMQKLGAKAAECQGHIGGVHDMNDDAINPTTGEIHAKCLHCGFIDPQGTGRILDQFPSIPPPSPSWGNPNADPMGDIQKSVKQMRDGVPYNDEFRYVPMPSIRVVNGNWTDGFTEEHANTIRSIVTLQGLDPYLIEGAIMLVFGWRFNLSDGSYMTISNEAIAEFKG